MSMTRNNLPGLYGRLRELLTGESLKARALRGSVLSMATFGGGMFLRLASNLILTRILFPEAFGLMAIVQVFMVGLQMFSDIGLNSGIVQSKRGDDPDFLDTAWTMQVARGVLLGLLTLALAAPAAAFYEQDMLAQLLPVMGLTAVAQAFISVRVVTAGRHLLLARVTALELSSQFVGIVAMIILALIFQSVWSLVVGGLLGMIYKAVLSHVYFPGPRNHFRIERAAFWELFDFGKYIFLSSICGFLINNGDRAILGKFVSLTELAVYNIAYFFATMPLMLSMRLVNQVMMPLYRERPTEVSHRNRGDIARARGLVTGAMVAMALVLAAIGDGLIRLLYTPEYHMAGPILVFLTLAVLPTVIITSYSTLLMARGNSRGFFIILLVTALMQTGFLYFGVRTYGVVGAILAQPLAAIPVYPLILVMLRPYKGWDLRHDAGFAALAALWTAAVFWFKPDTLAALLTLLP